MKLLRTPLLILAGLLLCAVTASAATYNFTLGTAYLANPAYNQSTGSLVGSSSEHFAGTGAYYINAVAPQKAEMHLPVAMLGASFTVNQIASISYHTRNNLVSLVDFYLALYTAPYTGGDKSWYGRRLNAEPYLSANYTPSATSWNTWTTAAGTNQLRFEDQNHNGGSAGWYGEPTLAQLQSGPITWSTWPGAPGGSDATPFDYGAQQVSDITFQTGSGWATFAGYIDAISIALTTGDVYNFDLENAPENQVSPAAPATCITPAHPCVTVPVNIARTDAFGIRGFSATVQVSSQLALCTGTPAADITEGTYLSGAGSTHYEVVNNGGGSYTIDCAILGATAGATTASGNLFNLSLAKVTEGTGTVTVTNVILRDPNNNPLTSTIGSPASVTIDYTAPTAIANLASTQVKTGNGTSNRTRVQLAFTAPIDAASIEVWRAPFGSYPEYNRMGGAVPALPVGYPPSGWTQTSVTATGQMDTPPARDFWYYVAYSYDACGNRSAVSNLTAGSLDYHLGDVVDPGNPSAQGDDAVNGSDISRLGFHYGISLATPDPYDYLDVGPTTNYSVNARPSPDKKVGFEDMILFAINYGQVSAPQDGPRPQPSAQDRVALDVPQLPAVGATFAVGVQLDAAGDVQGASAKLAWNGAVVEPVGVESGALLATQSSPSVVLSPEAGTVDFALLGDGAALAGSGEAARVIFRVKASGDAAISLASLTARDTQNQPVSFTSQPSTSPATPAKTELGPAYPNPFVHEAALRLSLAREGAVRVTLYDLAGRRVRTLMDSVQPAGVRVVRWDGRNDSGLRMAPGVYVMRLEAAGMTQSRRLQFVP